jgi:hypothetical protein
MSQKYKNALEEHQYLLSLSLHSYPLNKLNPSVQKLSVNLSKIEILCVCLLIALE